MVDLVARISRINGMGSCLIEPDKRKLTTSNSWVYMWIFQAVSVGTV